MRSELLKSNKQTHFSPNERVRYQLDAGGYWEAVVIREQRSWLDPDEVCVLIRVVDASKGAVPVPVGHTISADLLRLKKA